MANQPGTSKSETTKTPEEPPEKVVVKTITYPSPGKSDDILNSLHASRDHGEFCDVQLQISSVKTVHAHKSLLAICSPYFEGMFSSSFMEATSEVVDLSHMCDRSDVLEMVIDTFYGRSFEVNEGNVSDALNLATMLLLEDLKTECIKVLFGVLSLHNAAEMLQLAINFEIHDLREKVEPIITARFHDYILFQDDIYHLSVEGFACLLEVIDTSFITRREKYVLFLFKWFSLCESEERAQLLLRAIKGIKFKLTRHSYVEYKDQLEDILNHLDDVNTDMSEESRSELKLVLLHLKPNNYAENIPLSHDSSDSDVEMEPEFNMFPDPPEWDKEEYFGPPTRETGFTEKQEEEWRKAAIKMAERDENNRRLWTEWPPSIRKNKKKPRGIRIESPPPVHRSRNFTKKSEKEQAKVDEMVDAVIVLTPSGPYLETLKTLTKKKYEHEEDDNDMIMICAYVPCTRAWYKITELCTTSIKNAFGGGSRRGGPMMEDFEDEEMMHMMFMDMPDMMMMGEMPHSLRRIKEMSRSGMPPSMLHRMMEMDSESRHDHMMMREMSRRHRRFGHSGRMEHMESRRSSSRVPSLTDKLWKVQYFGHKLFFFHEEFLYTVYCHDLLTQDWYHTYIEYRNPKQDREYYDQVDGLDLIVMGEELYAVHRVALIDTRDNYLTKRMEERIEDAKKQNLKVMHVVYKLIGEKNEMKWEKVMDSGSQYEYIDIDEKYRDRFDKEHSHMLSNSPRLKQPHCLATTLYAEDPFKLNIIYMKHNKHYKQPTRATRSVSHIETLYLDIKEREDLREGPYRGFFTRTVTPLVSSDYAALVTDTLEIDSIIDIMMASVRRTWDASRYEPSQKSEFLDALDVYPRCPSIMCSARDGKRIWVLRGKDDDWSEMIEVTGYYLRTNHAYEKRNIIQKHHPSPPFKCFTMATTGRMKLSTIKGFGLPLKYTHGGQTAK